MFCRVLSVRSVFGGQSPEGEGREEQCAFLFIYLSLTGNIL